jgi:hypothetical protein
MNLLIAFSGDQMVKTSIKQQVYDWIEQNPERSTLNNLFAVFRRKDKTKEFGRKATKSYLRQIYNKYLREHTPKERYCRFCESIKPNSEILIVDTLSGRGKFYCCKDCLKNNEKTEKYRHYPTTTI